MDAKTTAPRAAADKSRVFHGNFIQTISGTWFKAFLWKIVTEDETWLHWYNPEKKAQSKQWLPTGGSQSKCSRRVKSKGHDKRFWGHWRHFAHWLSEGPKNTNTCLLWEWFEKVSQKFNSKMPGKASPQQCSYLFPLIKKRTILWEFLQKIIRHPLYGPDLASSDLFPFSNLKKNI